MATATTYVDRRTDTVKPLHQSFGFTDFTLPTSDSDVANAADLRDAWTAGDNQNINLAPGTYEITSTLKGTSDRIVIDGGSPESAIIEAQPGFSGSHFCEWELGQDVIFRNVTLDAGGLYLISLIWDRCENVLFDNVVVRNSTRLGMKSEKSSYWTVNGCASYGHLLHHGIGTKDNSLLTHNFSILGSLFYANNDYGIDLHGAEYEIAGNLVYGNVNCLKMPDCINGWVHDNRFIEGSSSLGAIFIYDANLGRTPDNVNIYRNDVWADKFHLRSEDGSTIYWQDNNVRDKTGTTLSSLKQAGDGTANIIYSKSELDDFPDATGLASGLLTVSGVYGVSFDAEKVGAPNSAEVAIGRLGNVIFSADIQKTYRQINRLRSRVMVA